MRRDNSLPAYGPSGPQPEPKRQAIQYAEEGEIHEHIVISKGARKRKEEDDHGGIFLAR